MGLIVATWDPGPPREEALVSSRSNGAPFRRFSSYPRARRRVGR